MKLKHIVSAQQFLKRDLVEHFFEIADRFQKLDAAKKIPQILKRKILASVFYEPSTRTRFSFEAAMLKLGGEVISTESASHFSSVIKGESLEDTIRIVGGYTDVIVLRHPEIGAAQRAVAVSPVSIINAGDGAGEHPTQALLDFYTIKKESGSLDNFKIGLVGDLLYGRTIHSLIRLFSLCRKIKIFLVSPKELMLPQKYKGFLKTHGLDFREINKLDVILPEVDILYVTRIQKERFSSLHFFNKVKNSFIINEKTLKSLKKKAIILHPLPRVNEISAAVDKDSRAAYFRQAKNGLYIRMALLKWLLNS